MAQTLELQTRQQERPNGRSKRDTSQADLARLRLPSSRASEIMTGSIKHPSLSQTRRLHDQWHIPAEALIRDVI